MLSLQSTARCSTIAKVSTRQHLTPVCSELSLSRARPCHASRAFRQALTTPFLREPRKQQIQRSHTVVASSASVLSPTSPHLQLGTAKLPKNVVVNGFVEVLYQWAAGLTQSGGNLPFSSALQTDKLPNGFKIEFLGRLAEGGFAPVAILVASVEAEPEGNILFIRMYEGSAAWSTSITSNQLPPSGSTERLEKLLSGLPDLTLIMQTFPAVIKKAVKYAS